MKYGPGDYEIAEIGLDKIFEGILPGSETESESTNTYQESESIETEMVIDDPLGW